MKHFHSFSLNNHLSLLRSGKAYFARLIELINDAKSSIHFQVYIFDWDITGNRIIEALVKASHRGVKVYLVVDGYASPQFTKQRVLYLNESGIDVKLFAPFHIRRLKIGRRLHHKIILFDKQTALIGGINIADKYSGFHGEVPWLDLAIEVQGKICMDIYLLCISLWPKRARKRMNKTNFLLDDNVASVKLRLLQNDWWRRKIEISQAYRNAMRYSQSDLTIVVSYFLPGYRIRKLIQNAVKRGVKVTFIFGAKSDVSVFKSANYYLYTLLLKQGVTIYEWRGSILHAKFAIMDGIWVTVGSYNLNSLSDYGSIEANIEIMNEAVAVATQKLIYTIIEEGCTQVNSVTFVKQNTLLLQTYRWCCYQVVKLGLFFIFLLMRKDKLKL